MPTEPPHIRARRVVALERDVASVEGCVVLYDLLPADEGRERKDLWKRISRDIDRIKSEVGLMNSVSIADPAMCGDSVFIDVMQEDILLLEPILENIKKRKPDSSDWNMKRLHSICTEFIQHLKALRELYETFPPQWMQEIVASLGKIQVKICG